MLIQFNDLPPIQPSLKPHFRFTGQFQHFCRFPVSFPLFLRDYCRSNFELFSLFTFSTHYHLVFHTMSTSSQPDNRRKHSQSRVFVTNHFHPVSGRNIATILASFVRNGTKTKRKGVHSFSLSASTWSRSHVCK